MMDKDKGLLATLGLGVVTCLVVGVWAYGEMRFYDGRLSANKEFQEGLNKLKDKYLNEEIVI